MRTKSFARFASALALAATLATVSGSAASAQKVTLTSPFTIQKGSSDSRAMAQSLARQLNPRMKTPFQRVLAPTLDEIFKQANASRSRSTVQSMPADAAGVSGSSGLNFPGFVASPFLTLNGNATGDSSTLFATVTGDFNNDGRPDIAAIQNGGTISVILNPGSFQNLGGLSPLPPNTSLDSQLPNIAAVVAVDMNGDGNLDLVAQDISNSQIVIWLGHGDGTFGDAVTYLVAPQSGAFWSYGGFMLVGDFNGDGHPDVVALTTGLNYDTPVTSPVTLQTFLNSGDKAGKLIMPKTEVDALFKDFYYSNPQQAAIVSNDGKSISGIAFLLQDDAINTPSKQGANVLFVSLNDDGTFSKPIEPTSPTIVDPKDLAVSSFFATNLSAKMTISAAKRGDAAPSASAGVPVTDIVFMTGDGAVYDTAYQPGSGSFTLPAPSILVGANQNVSATGAPATSSSIGLPIPNAGLLNMADMNKDGSLDLLVYTFGSTLIFPNTGARTFGAPSQVVGGLGGDQQPQPADFDGSGYNSFVWADSYLNRIGYYQNFGASNAANAGQFYAAPTVSGASTNGGAKYDAWGGNIQVEDVGDFNGDGLLDVIALDFSNIATHGGIPDIVVGFNNGHPNNANQTNNYTFKTLLPASSVINLNIAFVEPVTVSGSAGNSILLSTQTGLVIVTADASGNFGPPTPLNLGLSLDCPVNYADAGDINGDGVADIVVAYAGDASCIAQGGGNGGHGTVPSGYFTLLGRGGGAFQPATFTPLGGALYMVKLINFSGATGNLDLAADDLDMLGGFYSVYTLPNKADGTGTFDQYSLTENATGYVVSDIIPGDFNNDGKQDLTLTTFGQYVPLSFAPAPDTTGVLLLPSLGTQGSFNFGAPQLVDPGFYAVWGSYADFNGDGYPDLALSTVSSAAAFDNPFNRPPPVPLVQILPNQNGSLGPVLTELDSADLVNVAYTFTGNFGNTGGNDLLVTGDFNTAEFLNRGVTTLTLKATASSGQGSAVTLTALTSQTVTGNAATGAISFSVNGTLLGSASLSGNMAAFTTTMLPVGTNTVVATYPGDTTHNASTAKVTVVVSPSAPMFALTASNNSLTLQQGATGSVTLNLTTNGTFSGAISFACKGAPSEATCTVDPASLTLGANQGGNVTLIVATTPQNNQYQASRSSWIGGTGAISIAGLLLFMLPRRRLYGRLAVIAFALLSLGSIAVLSGCGGGGSSSKAPLYPGTPAGNSTITVTATSGSITQTQTVALAVTQAAQ